MNTDKFFIGPMSKNIVDSCIEFSNDYQLTNLFGIIPSRRQVDFMGGYVNNWTTKDFSNYIKTKTDKLFLMRDHSGPNQGYISDDGLESLKYDCMYLDAIHIDPWKIATTFEYGCQLSVDLIKYCYSINEKIIFEIGTEESIYKYDSNKLKELLTYLKNNLNSQMFDQIKYAVIQSGTSLEKNINTGIYSSDKLSDMIKVCQEFNLISKEHNGDYLSKKLIKEKFNKGLNCINIAPEFGLIETETYISNITDKNLLDIYWKICYDSKKWVKWVNSDFNPIYQKLELIKICGHYVLSNPTFIEEIKNKLPSNFDEIIKINIKNKLYDLWN